MSIRDFLAKVVIFIGILFLPVYIVGSLDNIDRAYSENENVIKLRCKTNFDSLDLLFVGNSYTYSGINPALIDTTRYKSFNLGLATAGADFYEIVVNDYLSYTAQNPKVIFLLVSLTTFSSKADNFVTYPIHRYLDNSLSNERLLIQYVPVEEYGRLVLRSFNKGAENLNNVLVSNNPPPPCDPGNRGFVPSNDVLSESTLRTTEALYYDFRDDDFDVKKSKRLLELGDSYKRLGMSVVFYSLPTNRLDEYFSESYLRAYNKFLEELRQRETLVEIDTPLGQSSFRNIDHLNSAGAAIVTRSLVAKLAELNLNFAE